LIANMEEPTPHSAGYFRRGPSKVFYASEAVWDTGQDKSNAEENVPKEPQLGTHNSEGEDSDHSSASSVSSVGEHLKNAMQYSASIMQQVPINLVKPIPLLGHRLNRSAELDDILEESTADEEDDMANSSPGCVVSSPSPPAMSSSPSSNSPEGSFRMPRGSNSRRSRDSQESSTDSSTESSRFRKNQHYNRRHHHLHGLHAHRNRGANGQPHHHVQGDSGFSDSAESAGNMDGIKEVHSEVVHETRTSSFDQRQYHVSKVYFYSVSDIISQEQERRASASGIRNEPEPQVRRQLPAIAPKPSPDLIPRPVGPRSLGYCSRGEADHVSVLDCESFHKPGDDEDDQYEEEYEEDEEEVILTPPMATPPPPIDCDSRSYSGHILEHKPLPVPPKRFTQPLSPRIHNGTSSLGRSAMMAKQQQISPSSSSASSSSGGGGSGGGQPHQQVSSSWVTINH
jgi:hypothetical protein